MLLGETPDLGPFRITLTDRTYSLFDLCPQLLEYRLSETRTDLLVALPLFVFQIRIRFGLRRLKRPSTSRTA